MLASRRQRRLDVGAARQRRDRPIAERRQARRGIGEARGGERVSGTQEFGEEGAVEAVAGAGRIDGFHRAGGNSFARLRRRDDRARLAALQGDDAGAEPQVEIDDRVGFGERGQRQRVVQPRQRDVEERIASWMIARARRSGQSFSRRFGS